MHSAFLAMLDCTVFLTSDFPAVALVVCSEEEALMVSTAFHKGRERSVRLCSERGGREVQRRDPIALPVFHYCAASAHQ